MGRRGGRPRGGTVPRGARGWRSDRMRRSRWPRTRPHAQHGSQTPPHLSSGLMELSRRNLYWKPLQPPPSTSTRSSTSLPPPAWRCSCSRRCADGGRGRVGRASVRGGVPWGCRMVRGRACTSARHTSGALAGAAPGSAPCGHAHALGCARTPALRSGRASRRPRPRCRARCCWPAQSLVRTRSCERRSAAARARPRARPAQPWAQALEARRRATRCTRPRRHRCSAA